MKRRRLHQLSPTERAELNREFKDAVETGLIYLSHNELVSPIMFVRKAYGLVRLCIDSRGLNEVMRKDASHFRVRTTLSMS
jgi:hypothetical protein